MLNSAALHFVAAGKDDDDLRDADISQTAVPPEDKPKRCPWERSSKKQVPVKIKVGEKRPREQINS